jgi:tetratricopeptide (TPR) repeat protein
VAARERLAAGLHELRRADQHLAAELERRGTLLAPTPSVDEVVSDDEIAAALARWRAAHPEARRDARAASRTGEGPDHDLASLPMDEIVRYLARDGLGHEERQQLYQRLREAGRIEEYVRAIEALAEASPEDPELQVALGNAYLQQLFGVGARPEAGPLAMRADQAFDRALELDPTSWEARFTKAVALSHWPAFLGRGPEAIEHLEILIEQQAALPSQAVFALPYLFLGNLHLSAGERDEAIATWKEGLALFPHHAELRQALELAEPR